MLDFWSFELSANIFLRLANIFAVSFQLAFCSFTKHFSTFSFRRAFGYFEVLPCIMFSCLALNKCFALFSFLLVFSSL